MPARPQDQHAPTGVPPAPQPTAAPFLTLVEEPAYRDRLTEDWVIVGPVLVAGRTLDRVVVGPNGVFAVSLDADPRPALLAEDGLYRGSMRTTHQVKQALAAAFDLRRVLAEAGIDVFPYPVLVARGADGMLGRLRVVPPGCLASAVWSHPGRPLRRSERARVLAAVQHPATA
ncbi:MAG: hypothetical protein JW785_11235 [Acidimicrobiia bacterium]|nr:hypothetical protein [Acidimicrobiia bacterium]